MPPQAAHPGPGSVLGARYRLELRIGRGGMADVYRATDELLHRTVAIKLFRTDSDTDLNGDDRRIGAEMRTLAGLRHSGLVTLYDASAGDESSDGTPYLVMEFISGSTLRHRIAAGPLPVGDAAAFGFDLSASLRYVHANGIVHRDVKPANILLDPSDSDGVTTAKLTDFGIAQLADSTRLTVQGTTVGTPNYLSPEQAQGQQLSAASDVYSLGLVLIECLTGELAYPGTGIEAAVARLHRPPAVPSHAGPRWHELLTAMTARHPGDRPDTERVTRTLAELSGRTLPTVDAVPTQQIGTQQIGTPAVRSEPGFAKTSATTSLDASPTAGATTALGASTRVFGVGAATAALPGGDPAESPGRRRRPAYILGALAAVLVVALAVVLIAALSGGGTPTATSSSTPTPTPTQRSSGNTPSTQTYADVNGRLGQDLRTAEQLVAAGGDELGALRADLARLAASAAAQRYAKVRAALATFETDAAAARAAGTITDAQLTRLRAIAARLSADLRAAGAASSGSASPATRPVSTAVSTVVRTASAPAPGGQGPGGQGPGNSKNAPGQNKKSKTKDKGPGKP